MNQMLLLNGVSKMCVLAIGCFLSLCISVCLAGNFCGNCGAAAKGGHFCTSCGKPFSDSAVDSNRGGDQLPPAPDGDPSHLTVVGTIPPERVIINGRPLATCGASNDNAPSAQPRPIEIVKESEDAKDKRTYIAVDSETQKPIAGATIEIAFWDALRTQPSHMKVITNGEGKATVILKCPYVLASR